MGCHKWLIDIIKIAYNQQANCLKAAKNKQTNY